MTVEMDHVPNQTCETIYALASGRGQAGVAVIRVSGPAAQDSLKAFYPDHKITPRMATLCHLRDNVSRETLDHALVLLFIAPHSYTGENVVEYHLHGGVAVVDGLLQALSRQPHHRMAQPGEFTRRAFENGKMDLTEAEAIADLIHAQTALQKAQALGQMGGALADLYEGWAADLTTILAYVEAELEFPDEDLPDDIVARISPKVRALMEALADHLNDNRRGERLRDGVHIAVIGAPNAGKSSLVNALAQRDIAIVSDIAGTTRDVIEAHLDIAGYPVILSDTAGLRPDQIGSEGQDFIESEGIRRALQIAQDADIRVIVYDGTQAIPDPHSRALEGHAQTLSVINKCDQDVRLNHPDAVHIAHISVLHDRGVSDFLTQLKDMIENLYRKRASDTPSLTRARHREALQDCLVALERALQAPLPELSAEDLRLAIRDLGRITGRVDVEDLLDVIFRDFCIGK